MEPMGTAQLRAHSAGRAWRSRKSARMSARRSSAVSATAFWARTSDNSRRVPKLQKLGAMEPLVEPPPETPREGPIRVLNADREPRVLPVAFSLALPFIKWVSLISTQNST